MSEIRLGRAHIEEERHSFLEGSAQDAMPNSYRETIYLYYEHQAIEKNY